MTPRGFLTDLRNALGIPDSNGASKYGVVTIPKQDGTTLDVSLRITNHQTNANTYIEHNANYEYNISIVVKKNRRKNTFIPNDNVKLDEYVYYGYNLQKVDNPLSNAPIWCSFVGILALANCADSICTIMNCWFMLISIFIFLLSPQFYVIAKLAFCLLHVLVELLGRRHLLSNFL